jgi:DNA-binding NtrC family response regulator
VDTRAGRGTRFRVYLPASAARAGTDAPAAAEAPPRGRGECVLLVDDEAFAGRSRGRFSSKTAIRWSKPAAVAEALAAFARAPPRAFRWSSRTLMMPGLDGATLLRRLREIAPTLKAIVMTGGLTREKSGARRGIGFRGLPDQTFEAHALLETLRRTLDS